METHCAIQEKCCPRNLSICCLECEYGKNEICEEDCMNHIAKCGLGTVIEKKEEK